MRTSFVSLLTPTLALCLLAASLPAAAELKIGVVSMPRLQREAPQIKTANDKMRAEFEKKQQDLEAEGRRLEDDIKKFQRESDTMSADQRAKAQKSLSDRKIDFDAKQREVSESAQNRQREMLRELQSTFDGAIKAIVQEQGLNLVVPDPVYADDALDITDAVLRKLGELAKSDSGKDKKKKK